jgi:thioredoxin-related protein
MVAAILACAFFLSTGVAATAQDAAALPGAGNLAADGAAAKTRHLPILLFFNRVGCPYCERALREYLTPMQRDPAYADRVLFRQVEIDQSNRLVDFSGRATTHREFASRYKISLTPTIWFVDGDGKVLAEPIIGLRTVDFYGAYLDQAIADSLAKLQTKNP